MSTQMRLVQKRYGAARMTQAAAFGHIVSSDQSCPRTPLKHAYSRNACVSRKKEATKNAVDAAMSMPGTYARSAMDSGVV